MLRYFISKFQSHKEDGANFCGLLRKNELYGYKKYFAKLYLQLIVADNVKTVCYNTLGIVWYSINCLAPMPKL